LAIFMLSLLMCCSENHISTKKKKAYS
jgi:hypothetical protein